MNESGTNPPQGIWKTIKHNFIKLDYTARAHSLDVEGHNVYDQVKKSTHETQSRPRFSF